MNLMQQAKENSDSLAFRTAARLRSDIQAEKMALLPSVLAMCRTYGVSKPTMLAALHQLQSDGVIEVCRGRRARVVGVASPDVTSVDASVEGLYQLVKQKIVEGVYRTGQVLPKLGYFVRQYRLSDHTVSDVYRRLVDEKLVYRIGRRWFAGRSAQEGSRLRNARSPVIVILTHAEHSWRGMEESERTAPFCREFYAELDRFGIQVVAVMASAKRSLMGAVALGRDAMRQLIRKLDQRYLGTLVATRKGEMPDVEEWVGDLLLFGRPVVWFDSEPRGCTRTFESRHFNRLVVDERLGVRLAVDTLYGMGHRCIAYAGQVRSGWMEERRSVIEAAVSSHAGMRLVPAPPQEHYWKLLAQEGVHAGVKRLLKSGIPVLREKLRWTMRDIPDFSERFDRFVRWAAAQKNFPALLDYNRMMPENVSLSGHEYDLEFMRLTPFYAGLLKDPEVTAIISPNDDKAEAGFYWLGNARVGLPRDVSLLSFDNSPKLRPLPVSTVDFGHGYLGFAAFHAILRDIPTARSADGSITAKPGIVDRGSVGKPRTGRLSLDLNGDFR